MGVCTYLVRGLAVCFGDINICVRTYAKCLWRISGQKEFLSIPLLNRLSAETRLIFVSKKQLFDFRGLVDYCHVVTFMTQS